MLVNGNRTTKESPLFTLCCNDKSNGQYFNEFASFQYVKNMECSLSSVKEYPYYGSDVLLSYQCSFTQLREHSAYLH